MNYYKQSFHISHVFSLWQVISTGIKHFRECPPWCSIIGATVTVASVILYFTFLSHLFPLPCVAGSTVPLEGFDSSVSMPFSWCVVAMTLPIYCRSISSVKPPYIPFVVSQAFMAGAASQAGNADSSWAPGLTSGLQGSANVNRGALLLVPQWRRISSFVFYTSYLDLEVWPTLKHYLDHSYPEEVGILYFIFL